MVLLKQLFTAFLNYPNFSNERLTLFNKLQSIDKDSLSKGDSNISKVFLFGQQSFNDVKNTSPIIASIEQIILTKYFYAPLLCISKLTHVSMCGLFLVFVKKFYVHLFYVVFYFLYLRLLSFQVFVQFLRFYVLCMFQQPAKICS